MHGELCPELGSEATRIQTGLIRAPDSRALVIGPPTLGVRVV